MTDTQQALLAALNTPNRKARANIMMLLAHQGDATVIRPLLDAINTRPIQPPLTMRNSGNDMLDAILHIANRFPDEATPHLIEISKQAIEEKGFWASLTDKEYIAAQARHEIASIVLIKLMENDLLAHDLFSKAQPK